ncbi:MAG TPA: hypothetical protein VK801_11570, partial [Caulobacteraceae bacterium]|nr:hypothetical protein [Caulobacteraceae bacterium]
MKKRKTNPLPPRTEAIIFDELAALCVTPGFAEVIATLCLRDDTLSFGDEGLTGKAIIERSGPERLCRTEISTLIGLLVRQPLDLR